MVNTKQIKKSEETAWLEEKLLQLQQAMRELGKATVIIIEGWELSGKGEVMKALARGLDLRSANFLGRASDWMKKNALYWPEFGSVMPGAGEILVLDRGWYEKWETLSHKKSRAFSDFTREVCEWERYLVANDILIVKIFLTISLKEQKARAKKRREHRADAQLQSREKYEAMFDSMRQITQEAYAPWAVIDAHHPKVRNREVYQNVIAAWEMAIADKSPKAVTTWDPCCLPVKWDSHPEKHDEMAEEEYKSRLKKLQKQLGRLHQKIYQEKIPVIIAMEGWDAAGKGGTIRRMVQGLDPRGVSVTPIKAPTMEEKEHHYLWRFCRRMPRKGEIAIFDRSWYGRVMVERVEGLCSKQDWSRAYGEMAEFEKKMVNSGAVVLKFFLNINPDEQLKRFESRRDTPEKRWKLTDEDWRNREKWDAYDEAIEEMLQKTSYPWAKWYVINNNDKRTGRIETLQILVDTLKNKIDGK